MKRAFFDLPVIHIIFGAVLVFQGVLLVIGFSAAPAFLIPLAIVNILCGVFHFKYSKLSKKPFSEQGVSHTDEIENKTADDFTENTIQENHTTNPDDIETKENVKTFVGQEEQSSFPESRKEPKTKDEAVENAIDKTAYSNDFSSKKKTFRKTNGK